MTIQKFHSDIIKRYRRHRVVYIAPPKHLRRMASLRKRPKNRSRPITKEGVHNSDPPYGTWTLNAPGYPYEPNPYQA